MKDNYIVYQHVTPYGVYYFGQTQNIEKRWSKNGAFYKKTALEPYIDKYGWDNIKHQILFRDQTKDNALWIEDFLIQTGWEDGVCINKQRSGNVSKEDGYMREYYEQNKDKLSERRREYYEQNREKLSEYHKQYREKNRDKLIEKRKEYYEQNRDKRKEYYEQNRDKRKEYYEQNREKLSEYHKEYYEQNRDKLIEYWKQYYEKNRDKRNEYLKQYRRRKKENKQLKEDGYIPLF